MYNGYYMHMTGGAWAAMIIIAVVVVVILVGLLVALVLPGRKETPTKQASAKELLDRHLAKGEVTVEEYERLRDALADENKG